MNESIKKNKLLFLQKCYENVSLQLLNLEKHISILNTYNIECNKYNERIYNLIKDLNSVYNTETVNTNYEDKLINYINTPELVIEYGNNLPNDYFRETKNEIISIIKEIGYINLIETINIIKYTNFNTTINNFIKELNDNIIILNCNIFSNINDNNYFFRIPNKFKKEDNLELTRELWIKIPLTNNFFKFDIIFKNDYLSNKIKTCQINSKYLFDKKQDILLELEKRNVNMKFIKVFIRHNYLGNIYCMSKDEYILYLLNSEKKYIEFKNTNFINIMKQFVEYSDNLKKMFEIIFILLLSDDDDINDIAGLLIGLTQEKKNNFYTILYNNLTFYLQTKIKKSNSHIKDTSAKVKNITMEDIDYKKQLLLNKYIPDNVKNLTLEKIEEMKSYNNDYYKQLTYVKHILNFPWHSDNSEFENLKNNKPEIKTFLDNTFDKLNNTCYGHEDAKNLLLQIIGKWISNPDSMGTSFGMVGPPGVGKTLLAKSIGKALNIPFAQITLGGQNDGELLHGHGYTYSGSQPGLIIKKLVEMGSSRCILYFDELDKACSKNGTINEITSILIHLTDPNMNKTFQDRFFQGVEFPLDKVIMIFSYNDSSKVDPILLDRLREITVEPYTLMDKLKICQEFTIPELIENINIELDISISDNILEYIITNYTSEAGIRGIKSKLEDIFMKLNLDQLNNKITKNKIILNKKLVHEILKEPKVLENRINDEPAIGIINGLYATNNGSGGITQIQIYKNIEQSCNNYEIKLTGKQGDVMKESVYCSLTAAIDYLKHNHKKYNIDNIDEYYKQHIKHGFHVHAPAGGTPKDGPSAGCTFTCGFISRILNRPIDNTVAMTGEIDLMGNVTKIGGLEFKLQGAKNAGVKIVYVSHENEEDINKIKKKYKKLIDNNFKVITVKNISDYIDDILI